MSIAVVTMVRNEAGRYLRSALAAWSAFADEIVALDDYSTDGTFELLRATPGVRAFTGDPEHVAWGNEWHSRRLLWDAALESKCDWLLWLDADMVPAADPRELEARDVDALAFRLYDLWRIDERGRHWYRVDGQWQAHKHPRVWMIRRPAAQTWQWNARGLHCGHLPLNYTPKRTLVAPVQHSLLHYGYADALDRETKRHAYCSNAQLLSPQEYSHAASISDDAFIAFQLPMVPAWPLSRSGRESSLAPVSAANSTSSTPTTAASARYTPLQVLS